MRKRSTWGFIGAGLVVALLLAFFASPHASSSPDGLEKVAADKGVDSGVKDHAAADSPLADYGVKGIDDSKLSTGLAGVIGVILTFAVGMGLFLLLRWRRRDGVPPAAVATAGSPGP